MNARTALVTGGTSGIGLAVVRLLAADWRVIFCGRRQELGHQIENELRAQGREVLFVPCDVAQEAEVEQLFQRAAEWGGTLSAAVHCAGISPPRARLVDFSTQSYDQVFDVNVKGTFLCLQRELRTMGPGSAIVNVASVLGLRAFDLSHGIYTASKHAVVGLTKAAALEAAPAGIRVNVVCPGGVDTPIHKTNSPTESSRQRLAALHPLKRLGTPEEIAAAVGFLCSPQASFVSGSVFSVDGGASLSLN